MKKITFILFALIAGTTFAQQTNTDNATAEAFAEIVQPISIDFATNLNFGKIIGNAAGGKVTINPTNLTRGFTNGDMEDPSDLNFSAATFNINAASTYAYSIKIEGDETLIDNGGNLGQAMPISYTATLGTTTIANEYTATGVDGNQLLTIGGELTVNGGQIQSNYKGDIIVTVTYN